MNFKIVCVFALAAATCALAVPLKDEKEGDKSLSAPGKNESLPLPPASGDKKEKSGRAIGDMNMMPDGRPMIRMNNNMGMGMRSKRDAEADKKPLEGEDKKPLNGTTPALASKPKRDAEESLKDDKKPLNNGTTPAPASKPKRDAEELLKSDDKKPLNNGTTPAPSSKPKRDAEEQEEEFSSHQPRDTASADKKPELPKNETAKPEEKKKEKRDAEEMPKLDEKKPLNATTPAPASKPKRDAEEMPKADEKKPLNGTAPAPASKPKRDAEELLKSDEKKPLNGTTPAPASKPKRDAEELPKADPKKPLNETDKAKPLSSEMKPTRAIIQTGNNCLGEFGCQQTLSVVSRDAEANKTKVESEKKPASDKDSSSAAKPSIRRRRSDYGSGSSQIRLAVRSRPAAVEVVRSRPVAVRAQKVRTVVRELVEDEQPLVIREAAPVRKAIRVAAPAVRLSSEYAADDDLLEEQVVIREAAPVRKVTRVVAAAPVRSAVRLSSGYDDGFVADEQVVVADDDSYGSEVRVAAAPIRSRAVVRTVARSSGY